jgi:hypothetical protein
MTIRHSLTTLILAGALALTACGGPAASSVVSDTPPPAADTPAADATTRPPSTAAPAATSTPAPTATPAGRSALLSELRRQVDAQAQDGAGWIAAAEGTQIRTGGGARTGTASFARLDISDGSLVRLAGDSMFRLAELSPAAQDPLTKLKLESGKVWIMVTKLLGVGSFEVETPTGVATVRGSMMSTQYDPASGQVVVSCLEGACRLTGTGGQSTDLVAGQQTEILGPGQDPTPAHPMDAEQLADWAGNFPEGAELVKGIEPGPAVTGLVTPTLTAPAGQVISGYWLDTFGDTTVEGDCLQGAVGGGGGGDGLSPDERPLTPVRQVEDGSAILIYNARQSFGRLSEGVYARENTYETTSFDRQFKPITVTLTFRDELRVLGPDRIEWLSTNIEKGGCTTRYSRTLDLVRPEPTVLAPGLPPFRGQFAVAWRTDACPAALAQAVPAFTQIRLTPAYDGSLILYGRDFYQRLEADEDGGYEWLTESADGVRFRLSLRVDNPRRLYPTWSVFKSAGEACSGLAEMIWQKPPAR